MDRKVKRCQTRRQRQLVTVAAGGWWREGLLGERLWEAGGGSLLSKVLRVALKSEGSFPGVVLSIRGTRSKLCLLESALLASLPRHVSM